MPLPSKPAFRGYIKLRNGARITSHHSFPTWEEAHRWVLRMSQVYMARLLKPAYVIEHFAVKV